MQPEVRMTSDWPTIIHLCPSPVIRGAVRLRFKGAVAKHGMERACAACGQVYRYVRQKAR